MSLIYILIAFAAISWHNPKFVLVYEKIYRPGYCAILEERTRLDIYPSYEINVLSVYGRRQIWLAQDEWKKIKQYQIYELKYPVTMYWTKP